MYCSPTHQQARTGANLIKQTAQQQDSKIIIAGDLNSNYSNLQPTYYDYSKRPFTKAANNEGRGFLHNTIEDLINDGQINILNKRDDPTRFRKRLR